MTRTFTLLAVFCTAFGLAGAPANAQSGLEDIVRVEVLDGGLTRRGTHRAALRVVLADGWKTYWRAPGDSGIPPRINWTESRNVDAVSIVWPAPEVFDQDGIRSIGYQRQMVLPLEITTIRPGQPVRLTGKIEFGICEIVCVPALLNFDMALDREAPRNPAIAAALAERPYSASEAGVSAAVCRLSSSGTATMFEAAITMPSAGGVEVAVIEPGSVDLWASQATARRVGDVLNITSEFSHVSGAGFDIDQSQVRITVLGQRHAVDIMGCSPW